MITPSLPFIAPWKIEVGTMTCECPAIMHCQYTWNVLSWNIFQEHSNIHIMIMDVMHVNDIRLYLVYPSQKPSCLTFIIEAMMTSSLCPKLTNKKFSIRFNSINSILFIIFWIIAKTKSYITFNPISFITFFKSKVIRPVDPPL